MQKIFGIIGWIGTVLVFGARRGRGIPFLGIPSVYPAGAVRDVRRMGGPGLRADLHGRPVA